MEQELEQGTITATIDEGSVVSVGITADDGQQRWFTADGNLWRKAHEAISKPSLCGLRIEYEVTDWGGLTWFSVLPDSDHVRCLNCRAWIAPDRDPDLCLFGLHRRKMPPPSNGVHADV